MRLTTELQLVQSLRTCIAIAPFTLHVYVVKVKVKVKFTLEQATKAQRGSRFIAILFLQPQR